MGPHPLHDLSVRNTSGTGSDDDKGALRAAFDTNGDGRLTGAEARFGLFRVLVTNADGSTTAQTLTALGITEIDLRPDTKQTELPDGSVITGQTTFVMGGTTRTSANGALMAEGLGAARRCGRWVNGDFRRNRRVRRAYGRRMPDVCHPSRHGARRGALTGNGESVRVRATGAGRRMGKMRRDRPWQDRGDDAACHGVGMEWASSRKRRWCTEAHPTAC